MREPVGWLLGPELIGKLRKILRKRSDPRDWMPYYRGCVHDECWERDGRLVRVVSESGNAAAAAQDASGEPGAESISAPAKPSRESSSRSKEVWFDYIADTGDGAEPTYAVAYATMVSFGLEGKLPDETWTRKPHLELHASADPSASLRRGDFVFIGGDTAYHVADGPTLRARVQEPFDWAFEDAKSRGHIDASVDPDKQRRLYGIPGNHDWYDNLEGFSRVFRVGGAQAPNGRLATAGAPVPDAAERGDPDAEGPIGLPQLRRVQLASYVAIQLPYDWQLWGLDIDSPMDRRQQAYFESLAVARPDRLIIATPSPAIAFGAVIADVHHREAVRGLGGAIPDLESTPRPTFPSHRLDLSGDVHHYARYFPNDKVAKYGSVVSGLGGAFHHPSFMRATRPIDRDKPAVVEYPTPEQSRKRIGDRLLTPASTWYGSWARIIPFSLALILGFAAHYSRGGGWLIDRIMSVIPGVEHRPIEGGGTALLCALSTLGVFLIAGGGVYTAIRIGRAIYARQLRTPEAVQNVVDLWKNRRHTPDWFRSLFSVQRSYWLAWLIAGVSIAAFALYPMWGPRSRTVRLDLAAAIVLGGLPIGGAIAAGLVGGKYLATRGRIAVGVIGLVHTLAQVATALLLAQMFTVDGWSVAGAGAAYALAAGALWPARWLFRRKERRYTVALAGLALAVLVGALALIVVSARGHVVPDDRAFGSASWLLAAARYAVSGVAAMPLGTAWFVWYLAVAARFDAHNNEVGGAARVTCFRQMIRFRVAADGLTGYVIAIENAPRTDDALAVTAPPPAHKAPHTRGVGLRFYLIDVFRIATPVQPQQPAGLGPPDPGSVDSTDVRQ